MSFVINFLRKLLYKIGIGSLPDTAQQEVEKDGSETKSRVGKIDTEAIFAIKDGYLVVILDHRFDDVPSWMEWDAERKVASITHLGGNMDEVEADIKDEFVYALIDAKRVLLASNSHDKKIVHFVPFIARKQAA